MTDNSITILPPDDQPPAPGSKPLRPGRWARIKVASAILFFATLVVGLLIAAVVLGSILAAVILALATVTVVYATVRYGFRRILHKWRR